MLAGRDVTGEVLHSAEGCHRGTLRCHVPGTHGRSLEAGKIKFFANASNHDTLETPAST